MILFPLNINGIQIKKISLLASFFLSVLEMYTFASTNETSLSVESEYNVQDPLSLKGSMWIGSGLVFLTTGLKNYVYTPMVNYQFGISKQFIRWDNSSNLYFAFQAETAFSNYTSKNSVKTRYYIINENFLLGYEQRLFENWFKGFLEIGPSAGQRFLTQSYNDCTDQSDGYTFNGVFTLGMNFYFYSNSMNRYFLRIESQFMLGTPVHVYRYVQKANPFTFYAPLISLGTQW